MGGIQKWPPQYDFATLKTFKLLTNNYSFHI
jgi:hypothetical protein